jgi:hypothetical protein
MGTTFAALTSPFPSWCGPYSVARGSKSGFRFREGRLGSWVENAGLRAFWEVEASPGVTALERLVGRRWGSGRVLLLPDGRVAKPDPDPEKPCIRYLIGRLTGPVIVESPDGVRCDLSQPLRPGARWPGPPTTGLECKIDSAGRLECEWELTARLGRLAETRTMWAPDPALAAGLRAARPGMSSARVRVQVGGAVITRREDTDGDDVSWVPRFVGRIDPARWPFDEAWVVR